METGQMNGAARQAIGGASQNCEGGQTDASYPDRISSPTVRVSVDVRATRNFADALMGAMDGRRVTRAGWNAGGQYEAMQMTDKSSMMSRPYLYLKNAQNEMVPWVPSQGDLFARDWAILPN